MGIRFKCHHCEVELHVKDFQAGKRGKCPECRGRFRVPETSSEYSCDVEAKPRVKSNHPAIKPGLVTTASKQTLEETPVASQRNTHKDEPEPEVETNPQTGRSPVTEPSIVAQPTSAAQASSAAQPAPAAIREAPQATWYVRLPNGNQYGPAETPQFQDWLNEQRVAGDCWVWRDDWPDWRLAAEALTDFFQSDLRHDHSARAEQTDFPDVLPQPATEESPSFNSPLPPQSALASPTTSLGEANRLKRRQRRKRNYMLLLAILIVTAIALVATLIAVLMNQTT